MAEAHGEQIGEWKGQDIPLWLIKLRLPAGPLAADDMQVVGKGQSVEKTKNTDKKDYLSILISHKPALYNITEDYAVHHV